MATPEQIRVPVGDTEIGAIRWPCPHATSTVVAIHGITANAWSWAPVASQLDGVVCLVAIDLRGRGTSSDAPGAVRHPPARRRRRVGDRAARRSGGS